MPLNPDKPEVLAVNDIIQTTKLIEKRWFSKKAFEVKLTRPEEFDFKAGHTIRFLYAGVERYYSLASAPNDPTLSLCVRFVESGTFSTVLAESEPNTSFQFSGPHGYFTYKPSSRPAVFVATGTGIAPFVSMAKSGVTGYTLLHGVSHIEETYYRDHFQEKAGNYMPCISETSAEILKPRGFFSGRVTDYIVRILTRRPYDFYLCGRQEAVRDVMHLVDEHFPDSLIYTEVFF